MAVHQHGNQPAIDQVRPAAILGIGQVLGHHVHTILMPAALDVQAMGVAAAAAITNALGGGGVLQGGVEHGHSWVHPEEKNQA
ncbi:hypothetical protein D3C81_1998820 [compost metagenome]